MNDRQPEPAAQVDLAINRVLAAEQSARQAVERCRESAETLVAAAGERARAIAAASERRVRLAHRLADQGIDRALTALHEAGSGDESPAPPDAHKLAVLVARLAAELTGQAAPPATDGGGA